MCREAILSALCKRRLGRLELGGPPLMVEVRYSDFVIIRSVVSTVYKQVNKAIGFDLLPAT
jgi:hypothetical protein